MSDSNGGVTGKAEAWWLSLLRNHPWIFTTPVGAILSLVFGFVAREVLVGITTGAFLGAALFVWIGALAHFTMRIYQPMRLLTQPDALGSTMSQRIENCRKDFMREIGLGVITAAAKQQQQLSASTTTFGLVPPYQIDPRSYQMDEKTLKEVGELVQSIDKLDFLRDMMRAARTVEFRAGIFLPLWWPAVIALAILIGGVSQEIDTAVWTALVTTLLGSAVWIRITTGDFPRIHVWHRMVIELRDLGDEDLKDRIRKMKMEIVM